MDLQKLKGVVLVLRAKLERDVKLRDQAYEEAVLAYAESKEMSVAEVSEFADYIIAIYGDRKELEMVKTGVLAFIRADAVR